MMDMFQLLCPFQSMKIDDDSGMKASMPCCSNAHFSVSKGFGQNLTAIQIEREVQTDI